MFVDGVQLVFRAREGEPPIVLARRPQEGEAQPRRFRARLSSTASVQQVRVRGWDPPHQQQFIGTATAPTILLVPRAIDPGLAPPFGRRVDIETTEPLASVAEANAVALATLEQLTADRICGEAKTRGHAKLNAGIVVVPGCTSGYSTLLRLGREDRGMFRIPEIDDEVLVAFEQGDFHRPVVVGSLFDEVDRCTSDRDEDDD